MAVLIMIDPDHHGHRRRLRERFTWSGLKGFNDYEVVNLLVNLLPRGLSRV